MKIMRNPILRPEKPSTCNHLLAVNRMGISNSRPDTKQKFNEQLANVWLRALKQRRRRRRLHSTGRSYRMNAHALHTPNSNFTKGVRDGYSKPNATTIFVLLILVRRRGTHTPTHTVCEQQSNFSLRIPPP